VAPQILHRSYAVGMWSVSYSAEKRNRPQSAGSVGVLPHPP